MRLVIAPSALPLIPMDTRVAALVKPSLRTHPSTQSPVATLVKMPLALFLCLRPHCEF